MAGAEDTLTTEETNTSSVIGISLYIHPSDSPGTVLVPVQFDGERYQSWRIGVMQALSEKNKLGFIDGSCGKEDAIRQWKRCDDMVRRWILNSMTKEISDSVGYVNDSAELWKVLEDRYDHDDGEKIYEIQKEINNLRQGVLDITAYYTRMNKLGEELSILNLTSQCKSLCISTGAKDIINKVEQDRLLIQFLIGLNKEYSAVRGNILTMNPLPSMAQAFSLLIQNDPDSASDLNDGKVVDIHSVTELETKLNAASEASCLAILYFTATWCGPCRYISPFYTNLPRKYPKVAFLKADVDEARDAASRWNVSSVPSFFFIKNGKEIDKVVSTDKNSLEKKIAQYAG
ncbi:uncharacterized protein [Solanum lycopersicum]|uniref:uncharacterized protein n=1 Tax=Solanum lycopersicum TaxID=4081 RepID=UPI000532F919|nr:uncharacterized protein LOC104646564 [Solanum lycopersicum]